MMKYSALRAAAQSPLPLKYLFSSHSAKKQKKIVELTINILCAVISLMCG